MNKYPIAIGRLIRIQYRVKRFSQYFLFSKEQKNTAISAITFVKKARTIKINPAIKTTS